MNKGILGTRTEYKPFQYPWAFDYYQMQNKIHWIPEEVILAEDIKDWNEKLSEDSKLLLQDIFMFFTQGDCYCKDTEVLTENGWKLFKDVHPEELVAQYDSDWNISFAKPSRYIDKYYEGDMYLIKDRLGRTEQLVTPDHKIVYRDKEGRTMSGRVKDVTFSQGKKIRHTGIGVGEKQELTALERLFIAFQADGSVKKGVDGSKLGHIKHRFTFTKQRKIDRLLEILEDTTLEYEVYKEVSGQTTIAVHYEDGKMCKDFSWVDISKVSQQWARDFILELQYWDAHVDKHGKIEYYNTNKVAADTVQSVVCLSDWYSSMSQKVDNRSNRFSDIYIVRIQPNKPALVDGQALAKGSEVIHYKGRVYCLTMPLGTLITRRNLNIAFSGNCDVAKAYVDQYMPWFPLPELRMMMLSIGNTEAIHQHAYAYLIDTLGFEESIYSAFNDYKVMVDKHDYVMKHKVTDIPSLMKALAVYSGFTEGLHLFSSFAILLNFSRHNRMKGMGQIVTWSIRDEELHIEAMTKVFRTLVQENIEYWTDELKAEIYSIARTMVKLEDAFIDNAFKDYNIKGLTKEEAKAYVRYIADRRLLQLGLRTNYDVRESPLPWIEEMLSGIEHTNFFENRSTEYSKGALTGNWDQVWK